MSAPQFLPRTSDVVSSALVSGMAHLLDSDHRRTESGQGQGCPHRPCWWRKTHGSRGSGRTRCIRRLRIERGKCSRSSRWARPSGWMLAHQWARWSMARLSGFRLARWWAEPWLGLLLAPGRGGWMGLLSELYSGTRSETSKSVHPSSAEPWSAPNLRATAMEH